MTKPKMETNGFLRRPYGSGRLFLRWRIWWIAYHAGGQEIRESSHSKDRRVAEAMLDKIVATPTERGVVLRRQYGVPDAQGTWRLTIPELRALRGPIVYVLSHQERVLYIGCSARGLCRPLASQHHVLGRFDFTGEEELTVHSCDSVDEALALEARLIATIQPQLNRISPKRGVGAIVQATALAIRETDPRDA
jgi:hypothetical protein